MTGFLQTITKSSIAVLLSMYFFSCNGNKNKIQVESELPQDNIKVFDTIKSRFIYLSYAFYQNNNHSVDSIWNLVLLAPLAHIDYLMSFKGDKTESNWYWRDFFPDERLRYKRLYRPNNETAALFYITAIHYKDYSFACYREIYDNSLIDTTLKSTAFFFNSNDARKSVDYSKIWDVVEEWRRNGMIHKPLWRTDFFWIGEKDGLLDRKKALPVLPMSNLPSVE